MRSNIPHFAHGTCVDVPNLGQSKQLFLMPFVIAKRSAYVFHKTLVAPRRRGRAKTAKDLYYIFYVLDSFPEWKNDLLAGIASYAATRKKWLARAQKNLASRFADLDSEGVRMLVEQRPLTAFTNMGDDQFGQYALAVMGELISAMEQ